MTIGIRVGLIMLLAVCFSIPATSQDTGEIREALEALELLDSELLEDPAEVMAWVTLPRSIDKGQVVTLKVTIENCRTDEKFRLSVIDIGDGLLDGFRIGEFDPEPRHKDHSLGTLTLEFPIDIPPNSTQEFEIRLRSKKAGAFIGDVDIYEGVQFLTRVAQIRVR